MATKKRSAKRSKAGRSSAKASAAKKASAKRAAAAGGSRSAPRGYVRAGKALAGRAAAGQEWEPAAPQPLTAAAVEEVKEPRPSTTRYPISEEEFRALKEAAPKSKLAKKTAEIVKDSRRKRAAVAALAVAPPALEPGGAPSLAPTGSANFAGIPATGWIPADCTMATGPSHVLLAVNSSVAIYNKTGGPPLLQRTLTQWFGNSVAGLTVFDPKALYDQHAGRWVLVAVAIRNNPQTSFHLLSVSTTSDPLGPWRNYKFDARFDGTRLTSNWADYPTIGVDNQAFYLTSNMFEFGGGFQYAKLRIIPKAGPYAGAPAPFFDFVNLRNLNNTRAFTIQPCHTFGAPQVQYMVNSAFPSGNFLTVWRVTNPTTAPVVTRVQVPVSAYNMPPNADQKGGAPPLNTGDVRALHAVFRGGSLWTAFTTAHNWGTGSNKASIQWCQLDPAVPSVVQQGVYGTSNMHYFYPAGSPDANGNLTMVFSRAGTGEFGSLFYTGRRSTDPLGTLQASTLLKAGAAHYQALDSQGRNRWGDYAGVSADPANGRLVWLYGMFASAPNVWGTWVGSAFF